MENMQEGDTVILRKGSYLKSCVLRSGRSYNLGRRGEGQFSINFDAVLGLPFGTSYKMIRTKNKVFDLELIDLSTSQEIAAEIACGEDNRDLIDDGKSQKLTKEDINGLVNSGLSGNQVIQTITENSTTFHEKTRFSQEKYVKKKQRKYDEVVILQRPSIRLVCDMYFIQDPLKIANLRIDSLSQLLSFGNIRPGGRYAVFESGTLGLVTAAVLQRVGSEGHLVQIFQGNHPQREVVDLMNFSQNQLEVLSFLNVTELSAANHGVSEIEVEEPRIPPPEVIREMGVIDNVETEAVAPAEATNNGNTSNQSKLPSKPQSHKFIRRRLDDIRESLRVLSGSVEGLIVSCRQVPNNVTLALLPFLKPGHPFVVYSPYRELLVDLFCELKSVGCVNVKLCETWLRHYQILPERTHPSISMSGGGGSILYGWKVLQ